MPSSTARQQAFLRLAKVAHIPKAAQEAWIQISHYPFGSFVLMHVCCLSFSLLAIGQFFLGSLNYPSASVRTWMRVLGSSTIVTQVLAAVVAHVFGPNATTRYPRLLALPIVIVGPFMCVILFHICSPVSLVPYQNRFLFLVSISTSISFGNTFMMLFFLHTERGPPSTHPMLTLLRGAFLTLRNADCFSDGMVIRVLWERVRLCFSDISAPV